MKRINPDIQKHIEKNIYPIYKKNEIGHGIEHIKYVTKRSFTFAKEIEDININMVYVIASYHDIGHHVDAKNHEKISSEMFYADEKIKQFFTNEEAKIIKEAIEDHRASAGNEPRSIYGKIVSSADRNTSLEDIMKRAYTYRLKHSNGDSIEELILEAQKHIHKKYGSKGYAKNKMYFKDKDYDLFINEVEQICNDENKFRSKFIEVNKIEVKWEN